ncbi:hypothetical protein [Mycobacterium simiae]|uniref:hypothetical protein n=1 Tax=Mycobacterium simiae TaxID=1784 RepID=UPI0021CD1A26|nr:hypothetical protein [Mycobacterium simiae]
MATLADDVQGAGVDVDVLPANLGDLVGAQAGERREQDHHARLAAQTHCRCCS